MQKNIIYRVSDSPRYDNLADFNSWYEVRAQLDKNEHYLFREVWTLNDLNYYDKMIDTNFSRIIDDNWIKGHTDKSGRVTFYGCTVLDDIEGHNELQPTQYEQETCNL